MDGHSKVKICDVVDYIPRRENFTCRGLETSYLFCDNDHLPSEDSEMANNNT